jgi:hypothetical protein
MVSTGLNGREACWGQGWPVLALRSLPLRTHPRKPANSSPAPRDFAENCAKRVSESALLVRQTTASARSSSRQGRLPTRGPSARPQSLRRRPGQEGHSDAIQPHAGRAVVRGGAIVDLHIESTGTIMSGRLLRALTRRPCAVLAHASSEPAAIPVAPAAPARPVEPARAASTERSLLASDAGDAEPGGATTRPAAALCSSFATTVPRS